MSQKHLEPAVEPNLKEIMTAEGLSQRAAAARLGISASSLNRLLTGALQPGPGVLESYARCLQGQDVGPLPDMRKGCGTASRAKETVTLFLDPAQAEALRDLARSCGVTRSALVAELVAFMLAPRTRADRAKRRAAMFGRARTAR